MAKKKKKKRPKAWTNQANQLLAFIQKEHIWSNYVNLHTTQSAPQEGIIQ